MPGTNNPDQQQGGVTIYIDPNALRPDRGDRIAPQGMFGPSNSAALLDDPRQAVALMAAAEQVTATPKKNALFSMLGDIWNSSWGRWVFLGTAGVILSLIFYSAFHRTSKKPDSAFPPNMNPAQAEAAQAKLAQQISSTTQDLKASGYSDETIARAQNEVTLMYGTRIVEATAVAPQEKSTKNLVVIGAFAPDHYAGLDTINAHSYINSLSAHPTVHDLARNSAVVHQASAEIEK